jgi:amidohydrolase
MIHLRPEVEALREETIANRRWFHAHPELSFREVKTSARISDLLRSYGITEIWDGVSGTGVVAVVRGGRPGPCIALRADIDALPLEETADVAYRSTNAGVMHACGHDGHIACLLTVAKLLVDCKATLAGSVKLIFQPAEEDTGGAAGMIAAGCLTDAMGPRVDQVYGLHLWSYIPIGKTCCDHGSVMASCDDFTITVRGTGGHGAEPRGTVDAIVEAAHVITALQTIVSRNVDPVDAVVLSCGKVSGGHGYNIIADRVDISGTYRLSHRLGWSVSSS